MEKYLQKITIGDCNLQDKLEKLLEENANLRGMIGGLEEKLDLLEDENCGLRETISNLMEDLNYKED